MEMKSRLPQIIYTLTAIFTAGTVATTVLYQSTSKEILLTLAISFGTCAYHFIMRLLVGSIVNSILHNKVDYCKRWFQVSESEKKIYEKLGVKKWKNKMPTYRDYCGIELFAGFRRDKIWSISGFHYYFHCICRNGFDFCNYAAV